MPELLSRYEEFNSLCAKKRQAGADLSPLEPLRRKAETAFKNFDIPGLLETLGEGLAALRGNRWDERQRFIASLAVQADCLVVEPNQDLHVALARMFPSNADQAFAASPVVSIAIVPAGPSGPRPGGGSGEPDLRQPAKLAERLPIAETMTTANRRVRLADGAYLIVATVESGGQQVAEVSRPLYAIGDFSDRIAQIGKAVAEIKGSGEPRVKALSHLAATADFQLQRLAPPNRIQGPVGLNPIAQLDQIETEMAALRKGLNPFVAERGELERAYLDAAGRLVPYRLYVPQSYVGVSPAPVVVMLHGFLGDQGYFLNGFFDPTALKTEAERRACILVFPNAGGSAATYQQDALQDIIEVIRVVSRDYKVDASRIYLTGHGVGGSGVWLLAATQPQLFAAIAPVAGGGPQDAQQRSAILDRVKELPILVVQSAKDGIVAPSRSRDMAEAAKKAGLKAEYLEIPNADHLGVFAEAFPSVMEFFSKCVKAAAAK